MANVFISSVSADLREYRSAAVGALARLGHQAVTMEASSTIPPLHVSRSLIAASDLFVGLFAWLYGYVPERDNPTQKSLVELEFRHARELNKPILLFVAESKSNWPRNFVDGGDLGARVQAFRDEILEQHPVNFFSTPEELTVQLTAAVTSWQSAWEKSARVLPPDVDVLDLAFLLVVDHKAEPTLLLHMDPNALSDAVLRWAKESDAARSVEASALFARAHAELKAKYSHLAPNPLWVAWMHATRSHLLGGNRAGAVPHYSPSSAP